MADIDLREANRRFHDYEASQYDHKWGIQYDNDSAVRVKAKYEKVLKRSYPHSQRVLEVGCGTGFVIINLSLNEGLIQEANACDISPGMVKACGENAERLGVKVDVKVGEMESLPYPDQYFDMVIGHAILHHVPDVREGLAEVHRILKPGGICMLAGEPTEIGDFLGKLAREATSRLLDIYVNHGGYFGGLPAKMKENSGDEDKKSVMDLEGLVDVHTFRPRETVRLAREVGFAEVCYHGEELLSSFVGWITRTIENTLSEDNLTFRWRMWSYNTHLKLSAFDDRIYRFLPSSIFYNMLLYLKK